MKVLCIVLAALVLAVDAQSYESREKRDEVMRQFKVIETHCKAGIGMTEGELELLYATFVPTSAKEESMANCLLRNLHIIDSNGRYNKTAVYTAAWQYWRMDPPQGPAIKRVAECCAKEALGKINYEAVSVLFECIPRRTVERKDVLKFKDE